jgi:hypothetical protein
MGVQGGIGMGPELGFQQRSLGGRDLAGTTRDWFGGERASGRPLLLVAADSASTDPKDSRRFVAIDPLSDGVPEMGAQIQRVGTHGSHLHDHSSVSLGQPFRNPL